MRKKIALLLCLTLSILTLVGCENKSDGTSDAIDVIVETTDKKDDNSESVSENTIAETENKETTAITMTELVRPDISKLVYEEYLTLGDYKTLDVKIEKDEVSEEDIQMYLNNMLSSYAEYKDIEGRTTQKGDSLNISFTGKIDGEEFEGGSADDYKFTLGNGTFLEDFEAPLYNINVGDIVVVDVTFPEGYSSTLDGKTAEFTIVLNSAQEIIIPELTEEFISEISQTAKTEEDLKKEIKKTLEISYEAGYQDSLYGALVDALTEKSPLKEIPEELYNYYRDSLKAYYSEYAMVYGISLEEFLSVYCEMTTEDFEKECDKYADIACRQSLSLYSVAEKEGITLSDEEYEEGLKALCEEFDYESVEQLKEEVSSYNGEYEMRENMLFDKVCEKLVELNNLK